MRPDLSQWIPQEFLPVVEARIKIFESKNGWEQQAEVLETFSQKLKSFGSVKPANLAPLTAQALPTDEIAQALKELEMEISRFQAAQVEIGKCESEILRAQGRKEILVVGLVVVAILLLAYLVF